MTEQKQMRKSMRDKRISLSARERKLASKKAARHLQRNALFQRSHRIACYLPVNGELDPRPLIERIWKHKKACYLPVLGSSHKNSLWFAPFNENTALVPNRFGIPEPANAARHRVPAWALDLVLTPLVAFDGCGRRIGMGAGYYDRTLAYLMLRRHWRKPRLVGLAYEFQKVDYIPKNPWDVEMFAIATEARLYTASVIPLSTSDHR